MANGNPHMIAFVLNKGLPGLRIAGGSVNIAWNGLVFSEQRMSIWIQYGSISIRVSTRSNPYYWRKFSGSTYLATSLRNINHSFEVDIGRAIFVTKMGFDPVTKCISHRWICRENSQPKIIPSIHPIIPHKGIQIDSALFLNRVAIEPGAGLGVEVAEAVVEETGFGVGVFGGEAEVDLVGSGAAGGEGFAEGGVGEAGGGFASAGVDGGDEVAVAVVNRIVRSDRWQVRSDCKEAADGACAFEGAGEVVAPGIRSMKVEGRRMKGAFGDHLPAVPEEPGVGGGGEFGAVPVEDFFAHAPPGVVVGELEPLAGERGGQVGAGFHSGEPVVGIPVIHPTAVLCQILVTADS